MNSPHKDIVEEQKAKIAGAELDASEPTRRHGLVPLGSPVLQASPCYHPSSSVGFPLVL